MNISAPFIRRPVATTLLTAAITLAGVVAYLQLPVSPLPQVDFPTISVQAALPGASPETMASSVASPLERQLGHIAGVTEMTSASVLGSTSITLQFDLNRSIDGAARDVQAAINAARANLPASLPSNPTYRKVNPADAPIMILALTSEAYDRGQLYDAASTIIQQRLLQIQGVGQVNVGGSSLPAVRIDVNPTQLNSFGLGLEDVRMMLSRQNSNLPKGQLSDGEMTADIHANDQLLKAEDYKPLVVAYRRGAAVRLSDIANVEDSVENLRSAGFVNGKTSISMILFRQPGANIIETVDRIKAELPALKASIPAAINVMTVLDRTTTIRASVHEVNRTLVIAIFLVILVVFLFLRNWRATIIPSVVVPVSLIGTFGVMYLFHYSLDNLSLMAMTISTGFVVDDAIVVIENVMRYLEKGMNPMEAALRGAREVGFTVLSMSISLVAVFIPILLMGGIVGRLFREFAVVLSTAILVSLVVSLTTTPMMCSWLLRHQRPEEHGWWYRESEKFFAWTLRLYERSLRLVLRHPAVTLIILLLTIAANGVLFMKVPKGFFPQQDNGTVFGNIQGAQDASFASMQTAVARIVDLVKEDPAVANVTAFTGGNGPANSGFVYMALKPLEERKLNATQVIGRMRPKVGAVQGASVFVQAGQDLRIGGRQSSSQYQYTIQSDNLDDLVTWGPKLLLEMRRLPGFTDVNSDQQNNGLQATLVYDRATAARLGVTPQMIDSTLYDAFGQRQVSTLFSSLNQYHVVMEVDPKFWQSPEGLNQIYLRSTNGAMVPLGAVARYEAATAPINVSHHGQFPAVTLSFNLGPGMALSDAVRTIQEMEQSIGLPETIHGKFSGTLQAFQESLTNTPLLILTALAAVYIVLGILYESWIHPITILSTLPSAGVGAVLALMLFQTDLSVIAMIGLLLLIGLVKKNAILMIDFALAAERDEGKGSHDAIFQACLLRFRPILMTTLAAMLGALPLMISNGTGSELRRPLGITIVGGLFLSQILTLYTTPVVYLYLDRLSLWWARGRKKTFPSALSPAYSVLLLLFVAGVLGGCSFAPKYEKPSVASAAAFKELTTNQLSEVEGWKTAQPRDQLRRGHWWEAFQDAQLNSLEENAATANQTVARATANFMAARAVVAQARSQLFPTATFNPSVTRSRQPSFRGSGSTPAQSTTTFYSLPLDASWELDLWGRVRNTVQANSLEAQATLADLENVRLSVQAEIAIDYFQLRLLDAQEELLASAVTAYDESLKLTQVRHETGIASDQDVAQAQTLLNTTAAQATDLRIQRAQLEHALARLGGKPASIFSVPREAANAGPVAVPFGLPSELLERRPDVAAAERRVARANAEIGVARAAYFPAITLSGGVGYQNSSLGNLGSWPSLAWSVGAGLAETVFDAGRRKAVTEEARANYLATVATYRETVLTAFEEVENSLSSLRLLSREIEQQEAAASSSQRYLTLANERYKLGIDSYLNVITAQTTLLGSQRSALSLRSEQMTATVQLIKQLGGGWDISLIRENPPKSHR